MYYILCTTYYRGISLRKMPISIYVYVYIYIHIVSVAISMPWFVFLFVWSMNARTSKAKHHAQDKNRVTIHSLLFCWFPPQTQYHSVASPLPNTQIEWFPTWTSTSLLLTRNDLKYLHTHVNGTTHVRLMAIFSVVV